MATSNTSLRPALRFVEHLSQFASLLSVLPPDALAKVVAAFHASLERWRGLVDAAGFHKAPIEMASVVAALPPAAHVEGSLFMRALGAECMYRDAGQGPNGERWSSEHLAEALMLHVPQFGEDYKLPVAAPAAPVVPPAS